jgi:LmbE family N-acetylglucosaminyl deacetylase
MNLQGNLLVIVAHADDEIIGAGGLISRWQGQKTVVVCTQSGKIHGVQKELDAALAQASSLGVYNYHHLEYKDQCLDKVSRLELQQRLENLMDAYYPDVVVTHSIHDNNLDHRVVHEAVNVIARSVANLLYFYIQSPGEFGEFKPQLFVKHKWAKKRELLRCYNIEMRPYPHPRSYEMLKYRYELWGQSEAFEIGRLSI